jgi:hypothetical protein
VYCDAAREARLNRDRVTEPLLQGGGNGPSAPRAPTANQEVERWYSEAVAKAPTSSNSKGNQNNSAPAPDRSVAEASEPQLDTASDLPALLDETVDVTVEPTVSIDDSEGAIAMDVPVSMSPRSPSAQSGSPQQLSLPPVATGSDASDIPCAQGDLATDTVTTTARGLDGYGRGSFRYSPKAGAAADTAAAFAGVRECVSSGLNNTMRRDAAAASYNPVDTAVQHTARRFGASAYGAMSSDDNDTSLSISKLVGMLKARTTAPSLGEAFAGRGAAATWKPGVGLAGATISGGLKTGDKKWSPNKRGSGGTSQRWNPGSAPLSTHNFDGAASSDDEADVRAPAFPSAVFSKLT